MLRLIQFSRIWREAINQIGTVGPIWKSPFALSAGVHCGAIGLLAVLSFSAPHTEPLPDIDAIWDAPLVAEVFAPPVISPTEAVLPGQGGSTGDTGRAGRGGSLFEDSPTEMVLPDAIAAAPVDLESRVPDTRTLALSVTGRGFGTGGQGRGIGDGIGDGTGSGSGAGFFDAQTRGTKFVYVLDCSGSMHEPHSESRTRIERLKLELVRSIGGLAPHMEFFVMFFNQNSVPMPAKKLQIASAENKQKYLEWVVKVRGGGATDPRDALKLAFELQPDVIYLLTDGKFDDQVVEATEKLNTRRVSIHTFCLGDRSGEKPLRQIAERNGGAYKFVP